MSTDTLPCKLFDMVSHIQKRTQVAYMSEPLIRIYSKSKAVPCFSANLSKAVPQLRFSLGFVSVISVLYFSWLFLISSSFDARQYYASCLLPFMSNFIYEPAHDKTYNKTWVASKDSDQPVHPPSVERVLVHSSFNSLEAVEGTCDQRRL